MRSMTVGTFDWLNHKNVQFRAGDNAHRCFVAATTGNRCMLSIHAFQKLLFNLVCKAT